MKRTILFLVCLMGMTFAFAQGNMQDVVYLKNGSVIRGEIIEMVSGETVKIMTVDGCLFVWDMDEVERITQEEMRNRGKVQEEKFVFLSGLLSFMVPGVGQYYIGERHDGKIDLLTHLGCWGAMAAGGGLLSASATVWDGFAEKAGYAAGAVLAVGGLALMATNTVCSVIDAVKSAKRVNIENGYVMLPMGSHCAFGMQPMVAYEYPQYMQGVKPELSAGMKFKLTF